MVPMQEQPAIPMKVHHIRNLVAAAIRERAVGREAAVAYLVAKKVSKGYSPAEAKRETDRYMMILDSPDARIEADNGLDLMCDGCERYRPGACDRTAVIDELLLYKLPIEVGGNYSVAQLVRDLEPAVRKLDFARQDVVQDNR